MMKKSVKNYYPKDMTFCMYSDECKEICSRKLSDYEFKNVLNYEASFANFKGTVECKLKEQ